MSQTPPKGRINLDGGVDQGKLVGFVDGVDSYSDPKMVKTTQARWLENAVTRGAVIQTRPGFYTRFKFDITDNGPFKDWWTSIGSPPLHPQMLQYFQPSLGGDQMVFCISGSVWVANINADGSLQKPFMVSPDAFSTYSVRVVGCFCIQTGTIVNGIQANNIAPRNLLMMQDGVNAACSWDGTGFQSFNPTKRITTDSGGNTLFPASYNETIIGLWMAWSGNRLAVSQGPLIRFSDLGDPTHFTEEMYQNSGGAWTLTQDCIGMIDRGISGTTNSQLIVGTRDNIWAFATGTIQRLPTSTAAGWIGTANFQTKMFSGVGCVAGKSFIVHRGLLYWMSADGIVVFDSTGTVFTTQNLPPIDQEMDYSKRKMAGDLSGVCAGIRDSYVFWGVPVGPVSNGRPYNGHIQVLDRQTTVVHTLGLNGPYTYGTIGWQGVWTGIRPVEWATADINGINRPYALSMDQDGVIRIWEAFQGNRADNGHPIPWTFETRAHIAAKSLFETNVFRYGAALLDQMLGNVNVTVSWRGMRGVWKEAFTGSYTATPGSVLLPLADYTPIVNGTQNETFTIQTRDLITPNDRSAESPCQATNVESPFQDQKDHAFSLLFNVTGRCAIIAYRIAVDEQPDDNDGNAEPVAETGFNIVPENDCPERICLTPGQTTPDYVFPTSNFREAFSPIVDVTPNPTLYMAPSS
jgi:hypothetical protein